MILLFILLSVNASLSGAKCLCSCFLSYRNIEVLTVGKGLLEDDFFHVLSDCPALKHLNISEASLGSGLQEIPVAHEMLRHLQIVKCRALRISVR